MIKLVTSTILIGIAVAGFLLVIKPLSNDISVIKTEASAYNEALSNSKALENEKDKLTKVYNSILPENLVKLEKLLPDNVDNIRLILEIERLASPYGMSLRDVRYDTLSKEDSAVKAAGVASTTDRGDYGEWTLEFSTSATYNNFIFFVKALEKNLRIVDISSIQFSSNSGAGANPGFNEVYKYDFKIKTYWLKN